jgi:hypothetical protein
VKAWRGVPNLLYRRFPKRLIGVGTGRLDFPTPRKFGNLRYSRLGSLRYGIPGAPRVANFGVRVELSGNCQVARFLTSHPSSKFQLPVQLAVHL